MSELFESWALDDREPERVTQLRDELQLQLCRELPFAHQVTGIDALIRHPYFALFDEMGAGKTLQTIVAAIILFLRGVIDRVIVIAPATVRSVWFDQELGELSKHLFTPSLISEYHSKIKQWQYLPDAGGTRMRWIITNYDFVRKTDRLVKLLQYCTPKTLVVFDESSAIKNRTALQTKAAFMIRWACGRVVLLNGTPIAHTPLDLFTQGNIMHPSILQCKSFYQFRARYAIMAPNSNFPQITGWQNLEDLQRRFAPYVLRRLKADCLDLPEKLPATPYEVRLTPKTWRIYKEMRDELVAWFDTQHVSIAAQAVTKVMRLAQITSGFLGGVEFEPDDELLDDSMPDFIESTIYAPVEPVVEIGREKLDALIALLNETLDADATAKRLIWFCFKPELRRALDVLLREFPRTEIGAITGQQKRAERERSKRLLDPRTAPAGSAFVLATAGHKGLNLTAADCAVYCSHDPSLEKRKQSEDRLHRTGQRRTVSYIDFMATGPDGQKTIDHIRLKARKQLEDVATWTCSAWSNALREE